VFEGWREMPGDMRGELAVRFGKKPDGRDSGGVCIPDRELASTTFLPPQDNSIKKGGRSRPS
jgi:hypothetical protein